MSEQVETVLVVGGTSKAKAELLPFNPLTASASNVIVLTDTNEKSQSYKSRGNNVAPLRIINASMHSQYTTCELVEESLKMNPETIILDLADYAPLEAQNLPSKILKQGHNLVWSLPQMNVIDAIYHARDHSMSGHGSVPHSFPSTSVGEGAITQVFSYDEDNNLTVYHLGEESTWILSSWWRQDEALRQSIGL